MVTSRRATSGLGSNLYAEFLANHSRLTDPLEPSTRSRHAVEINTITPNGTALGLQTCIVASFFKAAVKRSVESALVWESHVNSIITSSVRVTSSRHLALQAHLQAKENLRFTLEAQESATEKAPVSFARIGVDYTTSDAFAGVNIDPVNGPTLQATMGGKIGALGIGINGAYDVGLDHSDRLGRFTTLDMATSYTHNELLALLQVYVNGFSLRDARQVDRFHADCGRLCF